MDGHHPRLQVAAPTRPTKARRTAARVSRRPSSGVGASSSTASASRLGELGAEGGQRPGVELPQRAAQGVDVPLRGPDQALMGAGQHLDRLGQRAVAGDRAVVVAVGADQIGQHLGIPTVRLGPRDWWRPR